jgi:hypothetical protein
MPFLPRYKLLNFLANQPKSVQSIMGATDSFRDIALFCLSVIFRQNLRALSLIRSGLSPVKLIDPRESFRHRILRIIQQHQFDRINSSG